MKLNGLIPELIVKNLDKTLIFYTALLGFKVEYEVEEQKYALVSRGDAQIMLDEGGSEVCNVGEMEYPYGRGINLSIQVEGIDEIVATLKQSHYPLKTEIEERWYLDNGKRIGEKHFLVQDPDGYLIGLIEGLGEK